MTKELTVDAEPREDFGKHANRRLRRSGFIPAVVYGGGGSTQPLSVDPKGITRILHSELGHNTIFMLAVKGKAPARVMIRDWQLEPVRGDLLHVDLVRRQVTVAGSPVHLTPIEYRLLTTLIRHAGRMLTHQHLLKEVWGPNQTEQAHYLRVYVAQLRRKLEADPTRPRYVLTEPGVGYRLAAE